MNVKKVDENKKYERYRSKCFYDIHFSHTHTHTHTQMKMKYLHHFADESEHFLSFERRRCRNDPIKLWTRYNAVDEAKENDASHHIRLWKKCAYIKKAVK